MRFLPLIALLLASPALAAPEWREAVDYEVRLAPWSYEPRPIRLAANRPVRLHLINNSMVGQHFHAPAFFASAEIRDEDEPPVGSGVRIAPGERRIITLVPAPGRYRVLSANFAHRLLGMSAQIIVE
jgi:uncharacterized cupredoxin-like copper-binding protein